MDRRGPKSTDAFERTVLLLIIVGGGRQSAVHRCLSLQNTVRRNAVSNLPKCALLRFAAPPAMNHVNVTLIAFRHYETLALDLRKNHEDGEDNHGVKCQRPAVDEKTHYPRWGVRDLFADQYRYDRKDCSYEQQYKDWPARHISRKSS